MTRLKSRKRTRRTRRKKGGGECNEGSIYERLEKYGFFQNLEDFKLKLFEGHLNELPSSLQVSINEGKLSEKAEKMKEFELHLDTMMDGGWASKINAWHDRAGQDGSGYVSIDRLCSIGLQLNDFMGQFDMKVITGRDEIDANTKEGCCSYKIASSGGRRRRRKSRRKSKKRRKKTKKRRRRRHR